MVTQRALGADEYNSADYEAEHKWPGRVLRCTAFAIAGKHACTTSNEPVVGYIGRTPASGSNSLNTTRSLIFFIQHLFLRPAERLFRRSSIAIIPGECDSAWRDLRAICWWCSPIIGFTLVPNTCADCRIVFASGTEARFRVAEDEEEIE